MNKKKKPIEKYISVCKECQDKEERKNKMNDALLKDEMITIAERNGLDVNTGLTKDEIAEKLVKPDIYEDIVKEKSEPELEREEKPERPEPELPKTDTDILSPLREILSESVITGPKEINDLWIEGIEEVEENIERITNDQLDYWENIEEEWTKRASDFQEQIGKLREDSESSIEEAKELAVVWRNFYNKMSARMRKFGEQTRKRQEALSEITERYRERARETFTEESDVRDVGKLFALWSDFSEDIRKEMETAIEGHDIGYGDYVDIWEKFSDKTENILKGLQENQATQAEELYQQWNSNFKQMRHNIERGYSEYEKIYNTFWDEVEKQSSDMTEIASEIAEEMEENYSSILESYMETVKRGYNNLFNMPGFSTHISRQEKKVEDLKKRVNELEEQIEED